MRSATATALAATASWAPAEAGTIGLEEARVPTPSRWTGVRGVVTRVRLDDWEVVETRGNLPEASQSLFPSVGRTAVNLAAKVPACIGVPHLGHCNKLFMLFRFEQRQHVQSLLEEACPDKDCLVSGAKGARGAKGS